MSRRSTILTFIVATLCLLAVCPDAHAATYTASVTGNWSSSATWGGAGVPVAGDTVYINSGVTLTVAADAACASIGWASPSSNASYLTVNASCTLDVSGNITTTASQGTKIVSVYGILKAGSFTLASNASPAGIGAFRIYDGGVVTISGDLTFSGTLCWFAFAGSSSGTLNIGGNLGSGCSYTWTAGPGTTNFNGTSAQTIGYKSTSAGYTFNILKVNNTAGVTLASGSSAGPDITTLTIADSTSGSVFNDGAYTIATATTLNLNSGTYNCTAASFPWGTLSAGTGTVNYSLSGAQTVATKTYYDLELSGSGNKTFSGGTTITGNLDISGSAVALLPDSSTSSANTLTFASAGQVSGSWGGSASSATNKSSTYFGSTTTGILNVATSPCTTGTWSGDTSTDWSTAGNWCGGVPTSTTDITIPASLSNYPVIATGVTANCRTITDMAGGSISASGTGSLTIAGNSGVAITNVSGTAEISCPVSMPASASVTVAGSLTMSGVISGASTGLTKAGSGTLTLSGANTYTGTTTVSAGTLKLGAAGDATNTPLGTTGSGTTVSNGAALDLAGYTLGTAEALTLNGTGVSSGGALMNSGSAATYSGLVILGSAGVSIVGGTGTIALTNTGTITGSGYNLTLGGAQGGSVASIIGTGSGALIKEGAGTWTLSGANTYTGSTTVSAGILELGATGDATNTPLGTTGSGTTISSGAALDLAGYTLGTAEALTLNGTGVSSGGALMNSGSAATYSGLVTLGSASSIVGGTGTIALTNTGTISGAGYNLTLGGVQGGSVASIIGTSTGSLTKDDAGAWTLSGASTYTGTTTISAGTLSINTIQSVSGGSSAIGAPTSTADGTIAIGATGVLQYTGSGHSSNRVVNLTGSGGTINASGSGTLTLSGGVTGNTYNLTLTGTGAGVEIGVISTTSGTLTKSGTGTWTLSGSNSYTGLTTISEGTLKLGATGGGTNTPLGTTGAGTTVSATGAALDLNGYTLGTAEALTLNGAGVSSAGALTNSSASAVDYTGAITMGSAVSIGTTGNITLGGGITGGYDLTKVDNATLNLGSATATVGGLTISAGTLTATSGTLNLSGALTNNSTFSHNSGTVNCNGSSSQTLGGTSSSTFNNLTLDNASGLTLDVDESVAGTLTFSSGKITTGSSTLILQATATVSGAGTNSYVYGTVQRAFTSGSSSFTFPIGDASLYDPLALAFSGISTGGAVTASVTGADSASIGSSSIDSSKSVNHCWTVSNASTVFTSYDATFGYGNGSDVDSGATPATFMAQVYSEGDWDTLSVSGTPSGASTSVSGVTAFGDFAIGNCYPPALTVVKFADTATVVPGDIITYTATVTNSGSGESNDVVVSTALSRYLQWGLNSYGAGSPFQLVDGTPSSGLTLGTPVYSNDSGASWSYTPVSGGGGAPAGYDGNVTNWKIPMSGTMNADGANFSINYKVRVK